MTDDAKEQRTGRVYSQLWQHYSGELFDRYTHDLWYRYNNYDEWLDPETKDSVCLDAGFGSGRAMAAMLGAGASKVYGIDVSAKNVQTAQKNLAPHADRVDIRHGSVLDMPYDDAMFDVVHCYGVLHHTVDPYKGFQECCRVLKPGGALFIAMYSRGGLVTNTLNFARFFTTRGIPRFAFTKKLTRLLLGEDKKHYWYALLDGLYAPIRETYREKELREWYRKSSISEPTRYYCTWSYNSWPRFLSGPDKGLIILKGAKPHAPEREPAPVNCH